VTLLTAALIVRDEEAVLDECLASIREVVDEIVVVDTGSVDHTCEAARSHGARVFHHPWNDDFAEARNVALDHVTGDWVLYIDADERLVDPDRQKVEGLLTDADATAFRLLLHPEERASAYLEYRIWRNDPAIRFEGIIHETVVPAIVRLAEREHRPVRIADLVLRHVGYEGDQRHKHLRNLPLLRREMRRNPTNLFVRHHLFRVLHGLGEHEEADSVLLDALSLVEEAAAGGPFDASGVLILSDAIRLREAQGQDAGAGAGALSGQLCVLGPGGPPADGGATLRGGNRVGRAGPGHRGARGAFRRRLRPAPPRGDPSRDQGALPLSPRALLRGGGPVRSGVRAGSRRSFVSGQAGSGRRQGASHTGLNL
jgi:hypothetical protein